MQSTKKFGCKVMSKKTTRIAYLDAVKLVTMYLVILGHVTQMMVQGWTVGEHLWKTIYSFHMPLFMMVSGFFVSQKMLKLPFVDMLKTKAMQLLLPAVTCTVVCCIYLYLVRDTVNYRDEIIGNSWFLKTLFVYYVFIWLLKRTKLNDWKLCALSCIFLFLIPKGSSLQVNLLWPYFWAGYFLKKHQVLDKIVGKWQVVLGFFLVYITAYTLQWHWDIPNIITINFDNLCLQWHLILFRYIVAFCGCMFVVSLIAWIYTRIQESHWLRTASNFGKYTLGIYVLQTVLVCNIFPDTLAWYVESRWLLDLIVAPTLALLFLLLCLLLIHLMSKNKTLDLLFFGGQYYRR